MYISLFCANQSCKPRLEIALTKKKSLNIFSSTFPLNVCIYSPPSLYFVGISHGWSASLFLLTPSFQSINQLHCQLLSDVSDSDRNALTLQKRLSPVQENVSVLSHLLVFSTDKRKLVYILTQSLSQWHLPYLHY